MATYHALLVGLCYVLCPIYPFLSAPPHAARKFKRFLMEHYGFLDQNCKVVTDEQGTPTATDIIRHLANMIANSASGDHLVFYFCGLGNREESVDNNSSGFVEYLCCGSIFGNRETHLEDYTLRYIVDSVPKDQHITLIIDSSHSGGILEGAHEIVGNSNDHKITDKGVQGPKSPFLGIGESCGHPLGICFTACQSSEKTFGGKFLAYFSEAMMEAAVKGGIYTSNKKLILEIGNILSSQLPSDPQRQKQLPGLYCDISQMELRFLGIGV